MRKLHIDIETFCNLQIETKPGKPGCGVYKYAQHSSFKIMLFAFKWDDEEVTVIDCTNDTFPGESIPAEIWKALQGKIPDVEIWAHNANFERVCLTTFLRIESPIHLWHCTMIAAAYLGLPLGLGDVAKVLALDQKKSARGKALINFFCKPNKSRKKGEADVIIINHPADHAQAWEEFKEYNAQDVRVECEIEQYTASFPPMPDFEREYWMQDQEVNANGITIDLDFVTAAIQLNRDTLAEIHAEIREITGVDNPNSLDQIKAWLKAEGCQVDSLNKEYLASVDDSLLPPNVARVIRLRQLASRTSTSKYDTMRVMRCRDGRVRGLIQHYGANRTGRGAGRGLQPQNMKKPVSNDALRKKAPHLIDDAIVIGKRAINTGVAHLLYDDVPELISRLVRPALIAAPGKRLVVSDFAAIEGRVRSWMAGEEWALDVYRTHGKIYEATASKMFGLPIELCGKETPYRDKGKVADLALGYQGWTGALLTMGALAMGLTLEELPEIASNWRKANPKTVKMWGKFEDAARHVIKKKSRYIVKGPYCDITFAYERGYLVITLPSGRRLYYFRASVDARGKISYWGLQQEPGKPKIWRRIGTYGGKLTENITQAIARDILYDAMLRMKGNALFNILLHIHDEIVNEADEVKAAEALNIMEEIMSHGPAWTEGLPLRGEGYISEYYRKD